MTHLVEATQEKLSEVLDLLNLAEHRLNGDLAQPVAVRHSPRLRKQPGNSARPPTGTGSRSRHCGSLTGDRRSHF